MNPDKQYHAIHPQKLIVDGDASFFLQLTDLDDSEQLYRLIHANRDHLGKQQAWARNIDFEGVDQSVRATVDQIKADRWLQYRIMLPIPGSTEHKMIGTVTLFDREVLSRVAGLSFWLAKDEQGKGYARRGVQRLLAYAFSSWNVDHVFVDIQVGNEHGEKLVTKLGGKPTEQILQDDVDGEQITRRRWVLVRT